MTLAEKIAALKGNVLDSLPKIGAETDALSEVPLKEREKTPNDGAHVAENASTETQPTTAAEEVGDAQVGGPASPTLAEDIESVGGLAELLSAQLAEERALCYNDDFPETLPGVPHLEPLEPGFKAAEAREIQRLGLCTHECPYCGEAWSHRLKEIPDDNGRGGCPYYREPTLRCDRCQKIRDEVAGEVMSMLVHDERRMLALEITPDMIDARFEEHVKMCHDMSMAELDEHIRRMQALSEEYKRNQMAGCKVRREKSDKDHVHDAENYRLNYAERKKLKAEKAAAPKNTDKLIENCMLALGGCSREEAEAYIKGHKKGR